MSETDPSGMSERDPKQDAGVDEGGMDTTSEMDEGAGSAMGDALGDAMGSGSAGGLDDMGDSGVDEEEDED